MESPTPAKRRKLTPTRNVAEGDDAPNDRWAFGGGPSPERAPPASAARRARTARQTRAEPASQNATASNRSPQPAQASAFAPASQPVIDSAQLPPSPPDRTPQSSPRRRSFMSPTKASLARFNPNLLPRPGSAGTGAGPSRGTPKGPMRSGGARGRSLDPDRVRGMLARRPGAEEGDDEEMIRRIEALGETVPDSQPVLTEAEVQGSTLRGEPTSAGRLGGGFAHRPRRRSERGSEPLGAEVGTARTRTGGGARSAGRDGLRARSHDPYTHEGALERQLDVELQSSVPRGARGGPEQFDEDMMENKPNRSKAGLEEERRQVQMQAADLPIEALSSPTARAVERHAQRRMSPVKKVKPIVPDAPAVSAEKDTDEIEEETAETTSGKQKDEADEPDPEILRKQETLRLLKYRRTMIQMDVDCLREGAKVLAATNGRSFIKGSGKASTNIIVAAITSNDPARKFLTPANEPPLSARLALFLPFSRIKPSKPSTPTPAETSLLAGAYRPVELDQTDLDFGLGHDGTTSIAVTDKIPSDLTDSTSIEIHRLITLKTTNPSAALLLTLHIDTSNESIKSLSLTSIPSWAELEYGTWARKWSSSGDAPALGRAFVLYTRLDLLRASVWRRCCRRFGELLKHLGPIAVDGQSGDLDVEEADVPPELNSVHSGRQSLTFYKEGVSLRVDWEIGFDWTGEPESKVALYSSTPRSWRDKDARGSLRKLDKIFGQLLEKRGVEVAIGIVLGVIFQ